MRKLSEILDFKAEWRSVVLCPFIKKIAQITGNVRDKYITVFSTRGRCTQNRVVAQILLNKRNNISFYAARKRLGYSVLKVLASDVIVSHDPILDRKLIFRCNEPKFAEEVFQYEEICEKFDKIFSYKFNNGVLTLGKSSIFYYEMVGFLTKTRRERFGTAIDLMCDLLDVLYFYNKKIQ